MNHFARRPRRLLQTATTSLTLGERTLLMGILNATPDSFFADSRRPVPELALEQGLKLVEEGADILDLGGESTRPGSLPVDEATELARVLPVLGLLRAARPELPISIDTQKARVAARALEAGANIANDIWGLQGDPDMARVVAEARAAVVVMHNQRGTDYAGDLMAALREFFFKSIDIADKAGIRAEAIVLDPGIGFGKTPAQNIEVLARLGELRSLGFPVLLGTSRKSVIGHILDLPAEERLEGTLATSALGVAAGVDILRVHDVKANLRAARVADALSAAAQAH